MTVAFPAVSRRFAAFGLALAAALALPGASAIAAPKAARTVDMATVLKPGPLPELSIGDPNALPIVEYGSLTCPHCAVFSREVLPVLKSTYVDTGKVRFIFREFSRNSLDVAAFVLARCLGDDKTLPAIELLFTQQDKWAFGDKPLEPLIAAMRPTGLGHDKAMECLKDQTKVNAMSEIAKRASDDVKLEGTPTFVIDGKVYDGELSVADLKTILTPLIK